jgi:hypothetical protein
MLPSPIFTAIVKGGMILVDRRDEFKALKDSFEGRKVEVILRPRRRACTWRTHKYYRGVVLPVISAGLGDTELETHPTLKSLIIPVNVEAVTLKPRSTADLCQAEFNEYIFHCQRIAANCGIQVPEPLEAEPA